MSYGMGVMFMNLVGNKESAEAFMSCTLKEIAALDLSEDRLLFTFADGRRMQITDEGQSCCEERYLHSDDDLSYHVGAKLLTAEISDAPDVETEYGVHEVKFLKVATSKGVFTIETHNFHNGYYGGFAVRAAIGE